MRVTQTMMYNGFIKNMQSTLSDYMESNIQGASQKKVNRPSDDPAGMALILNTRRNIDNTKQYQRNVDTAQGWLNLADSTLVQVSTAITDIKTLAEQAATGTMTAENRQQVATQLRQLFGQVLNLSNKQFEGKNIFAGHKYQSPAFEETLGVTTMDPALQNIPFEVTGKTDTSIMVVFSNTDTNIPPNPKIVGVDKIDYQWSNDGGNTWNTGVLLATENQSSIGNTGVRLTLPMGTSIPASNDPWDTDAIDAKDGVLYIRPTTVYMGDEQGAEPYGVVRQGTLPPGVTMNVQGDFSNNILLEFTSAVDPWGPLPATASYTINGGTTQTITLPNPPTGKVTIYLPQPEGGTIDFNIPQTTPPTILAATTEIDIQPRRVDMMGAPPLLQANAQGTFKSNTLIRVDNDPSVDMTTDSTLRYSYSTDNGNTWISATTAIANATRTARLSVPGGYMDITADVGNPILNKSTQFVIHPDRADLNYEIMKDTYVPVNSMGMNIFGGIYNGTTVQPEDKNLFEVIGKLIAYTENNNQTGIQQCLEDLTKAQERVLTEAARIGGLENRLSLAKDMLSFEKINQDGRLSYAEDVDLTELLTRMARQELAYSTVLKSSSMIMQMNLTKYI